MSWPARRPRSVEEGDVIGVDIGLQDLKGYCGDACVTYPVGKVAPHVERLLDIGREALHVGIEAGPDRQPPQRHRSRH